VRRRQSSQLHSPFRVGSPSTSTVHSPHEHLDVRITVSIAAGERLGRRLAAMKQG
jgi:hypothetical protein